MKTEDRVMPTLGSTAETALSYTADTRMLAPIPAAERDLPTVTAEPYFKVSDGNVALEGPAYDREGNLHFVDCYGGHVHRLSPQRVLTTVYTDQKLRPAGIAIHSDGRIFVAGVGDFACGSIVALNPDGSRARTIVPPGDGHVPDDLVFDRHGGFYFTDFQGMPTRPTGGVYHVSPDFEINSVVLPNMAGANGVALSPDERVLWATEFAAGRLHRVDLDEHGGIAHFGATVPYQFVGRAPDSMRTDADGNVYVAMYHQGRILAFNSYGFPIGQILLPGRDQNRFLKSTSLAFVPGSRELVIVARDEIGGGGAMIFRAQGFARGTTLFSHQ
jgi:lactonase